MAEIWSLAPPPFPCAPAPPGPSGAASLAPPACRRCTAGPVRERIRERLAGEPRSPQAVKLGSAARPMRRTRLLVTWLRRARPGFSALRRAGRAALVMPAMFALGDVVIGNPAVATFAAFGSFAMLLLVDFAGADARAAAGPGGARGHGRRVRLRGHARLAVGPWLAAVAMALVAFGVIFAGVVSSVLAGATTSLLLAFILPVSLPGPVSSIPDRLAGWGLASAAALLAIALLWPAPARDPVRSAAIAGLPRAGRTPARAGGLRPRRPGDALAAERDAAIAQADGAVDGAARGVLRDALPTDGAEHRRADRGAAGRRAASGSTRSSCRRRRTRTASALDPRGRRGQDRRRRGARARRRSARRAAAVPRRAARGADRAARAAERARARRDVEAAGRHRTAGGRRRAADGRRDLVAGPRLPRAGAELRGVADRDEHRPGPPRPSGAAGSSSCSAASPTGCAGPVAAAQERAGAHVERHSLWLQNSVRGAVGAGARGADRQPQPACSTRFWVVLGTLSVLRSNALSTGQNVLRGLLGTVVGFVVGARAGRRWSAPNTTLLWVLLPPAVLFAGLAPAAISFAAGQAAFTLTLLILFNILAPEGWQIGLVRIEDVAIGGAVSLAVGLLFWPRGAGAALGQRAGRGLRATARSTSRAPRASASGAATPSRPRRPRRPRTRRAPRRPRDAWTTRSAATSPSAAPSPCRSPRSPAWSRASSACASPATPCSTCGARTDRGDGDRDGGATGAARQHRAR